MDQSAQANQGYQTAQELDLTSIVRPRSGQKPL
jgi:hypothetical protein